MTLEPHHTPTNVPVASGAGYVSCSCGWRSQVIDDGCMFEPDYMSTDDAWKSHIASINATTNQIKRIEELLAMADRSIAWQNAGFPVKDPFDTYPDDLWQAATSPQQLKPLLLVVKELLEAQRKGE